MGSPLVPLTRAHSALIRNLLRDNKVRNSEDAFVIEGVHACRDILRYYSSAIRSLTVTPRYLQHEGAADREFRSKLPTKQYTCSDAVFEKLSDMESPQGILAVVQQPQWDEDKVLGRERICGVYGEQLRDPANVGTIIRTAAALDLAGLWLSHDSADCFSPKVVRSTAGAVLSLPIFRAKDIRKFSERGCAIYSAVVPSVGAISLRQIQQIPSRVIIAVGNESRGLTEATLRASRVRFSIPLARAVESLNVAATVAISSFYLSGLPDAS